MNYLQAGVKNGKVVNLNIKTSGLPGGGLEKMMQQKYGKPAYATEAIVFELSHIIEKYQGIGAKVSSA